MNIREVSPEVIVDLNRTPSLSICVTTAAVGLPSAR
jgi:hypothetical protein